MWRLIVLLVIALACGGAPGDHAAIPREPPPQPVFVEWKVAQGEGSQVDVTLVVDGSAIAVGALEAATRYEAGTPATCALRAASPRRTELVCGDADAFEARLDEQQLVIRHLGAGRHDVVKRVPVAGDALSVKMLALPFE